MSSKPVGDEPRRDVEAVHGAHPGVLREVVGHRRVRTGKSGVDACRLGGDELADGESLVLGLGPPLISKLAGLAPWKPLPRVSEVSSTTGSISGRGPSGS